MRANVDFKWGVVPYFLALKDKVYKVIYFFLALFRLFKNPPHDNYCAVP